jgi:hypothetical protein
VTPPSGPSSSNDAIFLCEMFDATKKIEFEPEQETA